jgi:hypothetical protein
VSPLLLSIVSLLYLSTGVSYFWQGQLAWGVFWCGYAVSNAAFIIATR